MGAKPEFLRFAAKRGLEAGGILDHRNAGLDLFRVQVLYKGKDPAFGTVKAGRAAKLEDTDLHLKTIHHRDTESTEEGKEHIVIFSKEKHKRAKSS